MISVGTRKGWVATVSLTEKSCTDSDLQILSPLKEHERVPPAVASVSNTTPTQSSLFRPVGLGAARHVLKILPLLF